MVFFFQFCDVKQLIKFPPKFIAKLVKFTLKKENFPLKVEMTRFVEINWI